MFEITQTDYRGCDFVEKIDIVTQLREAKSAIALIETMIGEIADPIPVAADQDGWVYWIFRYNLFGRNNRKQWHIAFAATKYQSENAGASSSIKYYRIEAKGSPRRKFIIETCRKIRLKTDVEAYNAVCKNFWSSVNANSVYATTPWYLLNQVAKLQIFP